MATSLIKQEANKKRTLWTGDWSSGNINVPNTADYTVFLINQGGTRILATKSGTIIRGSAIAGSADAENYNQYVRSFGASISGNTWTLQWAKQLSHVLSSPYHVSGQTQSVTEIIGVI